MKVRRVTAAEVAKATASKDAKRRYSTPLAHPSFSVEPCPACGFPEADGGYCPECGWTLPHPFNREVKR